MCIDCVPNATSQEQERDDVLNVSGFPDDVFRIVAAFTAGQAQAGYRIEEIDSCSLEAA